MNETERPIRHCYLCNWVKRINNNVDLYAYVGHFVQNHPCHNLENMSNKQEVQNHRLKYHRRQSLVCLKIQKSNDSLVYELFKFRYECLKCEQRFESHNEMDLHICTVHPNVTQQFESQKIVAERTVIQID